MRIASSKITSSTYEIKLPLRIGNPMQQKGTFQHGKDLILLNTDYPFKADEKLKIMATKDFLN